MTIGNLRIRRILTSLNIEIYKVSVKKVKSVIYTGMVTEGLKSPLEVRDSLNLRRGGGGSSCDVYSTCDEDRVRTLGLINHRSYLEKLKVILI